MSFIFITFFSMAAFAQTQSSAKTALLNTQAFYDEKTGITKLVNVFKQVKAEYKPIEQELAAMSARMNLLEKEISDGRGKVSPEQLSIKVDEYERIRKNLQYKEQDAQAMYQKRVSVLGEPINKDINNAIDIFFKQKGVTMVLDPSKIQGIIWNLESIDMTKEFITFYNAR